jgi:thioredoxin-dependent peroxiredoxin
MKLASLATIGMLVASCATPTPPAPSAAAPSVAASSPPSSPPAPAAAVASAAAATPAPPPAPDDLLGKPAPDFTATAQDGTHVHLAALKGKTVVLYFYPKDETAGCTKEACSFRDAWDGIAKSGAVLVGVSADTLDSHKSFATHYKLPFLLVSDPDGSVGQRYGVPFQGRHHRETFVIGADGNVRKAYRQVDVGVHAQQILGDLTP